MPVPETAALLVAPAYNSVRDPKVIRDKLLPSWIKEYDGKPTFYESSRLWLYGNMRLLEGELRCVPEATGPYHNDPARENRIEAQAEQIVLGSQILVCGVHNPWHQRAAIVPLRWGSPRIIVFSGGFKYHLGDDLNEEPFRAARLWRYAFDPLTDLVVSRRAPDKLPTFARTNPTVDRLIQAIVEKMISPVSSHFLAN